MTDDTVCINDRYRYHDSMLADGKVYWGEAIAYWIIYWALNQGSEIRFRVKTLSSV